MYWLRSFSLRSWLVATRDRVYVLLEAVVEVGRSLDLETALKLANEHPVDLAVLAADACGLTDYQGA